LGRRQDLEVVYLDVYDSRHAIRYTAAVGETRPLAANSIGKALFSVMQPDEKEKLAARLDWPKLTKLTKRTIANAKSFLAAADEIKARGWASNVGESVDDLAAIAMPFNIAGEWYGVSVVGPLERMEKNWERNRLELAKAITSLQALNQINTDSDRR